jgi:HAD superfamily hydrolase (TIGR01509 family)
MIKLIIFDLDGVLIDIKDIHFKTLNDAIELVAGNEFTINYDEHLSTYDGLKTNQKLSILSEKRGLPSSLHQEIWDLKQKLTILQLKTLDRSEKLISIMQELKKDGFILACCSNSIRRSVYTMLSKLGVIEFMDLVLSNQDVKSSKPYPEIYWRCMSILEKLPEETLIIEDSPVGLLSANRSGGHVLRVNNSKDLTYNKINKKIKGMSEKNMKKWENDKLNVLIPMAGLGNRFQLAGYTFPKPLIDVFGKPMIESVVRSLNVEANYIYIVQKSHREKYHLDILLNMITNGCKIIEVENVTEGAACTTLLAKEFVDNDNPLLIANSDQIITWNNDEFFYKMSENNIDAGMLTFRSTHPKWSFAKLDSHGFVTQVAEKEVISNIATVGVYYWAKGSDYVKYAEQMIEKNIRINGEFYVCPVFNEAILDEKKIKTFDVTEMWGIGTPEDLKYYIDNKKYTNDSNFHF